MVINPSLLEARRAPCLCSSIDRSLDALSTQMRKEHREVDEPPLFMENGHIFTNCSR